MKAGAKLDEIDLQILHVLQREGRKKLNTLAEQVRLSIPSVSERLRKLHEHSVIRGYYTILEPRKVGLDLTAYIVIFSEEPRNYPEIIKLARAHEEIQECHAITGEGSHLLKIRTVDTHSLEKLLSHIQSWPGVKNTRTNIVLSSPKETTILPLKQLQPEAGEKIK